MVQQSLSAIAHLETPSELKHSPWTSTCFSTRLRCRGGSDTHRAGVGREQEVRERLAGRLHQRLVLRHHEVAVLVQEVLRLVRHLRGTSG